MQLDEFLRDRRETWRELDAAVTTLYKRGPRRTPPDDVLKVVRLYREASADLARLRVLEADPADIDYLNRLVTRAHGQIYRAPPRKPWSLSKFFLVTYPRLVRETWRYTLASLLVSLVFAVTAFFTVRNSPDIVADVMGFGEDELMGERSSHDIRDRFRKIPSPIMSSYVTTNNIRVALAAYALGITFGLGTLYILAVNGTMVGALAGAYAESGIGTEFWLTILPHGALELSAIVVAGGSGLLLASALWLPGERTRALALRQEALRSMQLVAGLVPAFCVAGLFEGFITPRTDLSDTVKVGLGAVVAIVFWMYCLLGGRGLWADAVADKSR